jgi:hypothetical protein
MKLHLLYQLQQLAGHNLNGGHDPSDLNELNSESWVPFNFVTLFLVFMTVFVALVALSIINIGEADFNTCHHIEWKTVFIF